MLSTIFFLALISLSAFGCSAIILIPAIFGHEIVDDYKDAAKGSVIEGILAVVENTVAALIATLAAGLFFSFALYTSLSHFVVHILEVNPDMVCSLFIGLAVLGMLIGTLIAIVIDKYMAY